MNSDYDTHVELHEPNHAVDDYLDKLLNDDALGNEHDLPPVRGGKDTAMVPDLPEVGSQQQPIAPDEPSSSTVCDEVPPDSDKRLLMQQTTEDFPDLAQEKIKTPSTAGVEEQLDDEIKSKAPSVQLVSLLKFQVMGINFAVPLEQYVGDYPCPDNITSEQDGPEWVLGKILVDGNHIRIANIAVAVIPKTSLSALPSDSRSRYKRVLQIGKEGWGLVCDGKVERIDLPHEEIRWRTMQGKRQWLAGTVVDLKCALLDVSVVEHFLEHGEWGN